MAAVKFVVSSILLPYLLLINVEVALTANILSFFPINSASHMVVKSALFRELASRGHNITMFTGGAENTPMPNYKEIILYEVQQATAKYAGNYFKKENTVSNNLVFFIWDYGLEMCDLILNNPQVQELIHSRDKHFDLIVLEAYFGDCFVPLSKKFNAPIIKLCTFSGAPWMYDWIGNPTALSHVPDPFLEYTDKMTFWQRIRNVVMPTFHRFTRKYYHIPKVDALVRKYFNNSEKLPSIQDLEEETTSMVFFNTHFSISYPRPLLPNAIEIGGLHLQPPKKLPQEIQSYLDEAKDGVIYFSLGSIMKSTYVPEPTKKVFLEAFSKLKENVLWKWEMDSLPGKPENVKVSKWLPQADILAHPNVRVFMTHGGQLSSLEAIHRGVPIVGLPIFGDQIYNIVRATAAGIGVGLDFQNISVESVTWALREVLDNPKYRENTQRLSRIFSDRPQTPLEEAVFWTEYVIRHKGAQHMRSAALDLTWYQYFLLDVIALFTLAVICFFTILLFVCKYLTKQLLCLFRSMDKKKPTAKKCD